MDETNRDLLLAVLALLTDAVPRHAISRAISHWTHDGNQSLSQLLVKDGLVNAERLAALQCLVDSHLARYQNDMRDCLEAWRAEGLTEEILTEIHDATLRTTLGAQVAADAVGRTTMGGHMAATAAGQTTLGAHGAVNPTPRTTPGAHGAMEAIAPTPVGPDEGGLDGTLAETRPGDPVGETMVLEPQKPSFELGPSAGEDRFEMIRPHAKGGIGQVWVARDRELQRDVALKVIQDKYAGRPEQRKRFLLEAEITGKLEHPGIVPVYSLGSDAGGRPYYAMRFIRGESLAAAIRQFHLRWRTHDGRSRNDATMYGVEFRELLDRFLDVCDAIDYAHSRGVLHRDIKPANIMLGRYGETLVVDWGLAKVIGSPDIVDEMEGTDAEPSLSASGIHSHAGDTQPGTSIGTPSYMSPEQARGNLDELGPASDVYSLGTTLYELLTGRVAFSGDRTAVVLERVLKGQFLPPREVLPSVPAALEAICLKAMARERRDRYATCRELARDIRHWLADEPVLAHPEGRVERLARWLRRHRTWTYAAAAALLGITIAATVGVAVVEAGRRREVEARALAETNFQLVRQAVDDYFTRVSEDTLLKEQDSLDMRRLRKELLQTALPYYREFLRQRKDDPRLRRELAEAQFRVGQIMREIGSPGEAIPAFRASIDLLEALHASRPADREIRSLLARSWMALGEQFARSPDFPRAFESLSRSLEILQGLRAEAPGESAYLVTLAECEKELAIAEDESGEPERGIPRLRDAEATLRGLLERKPKDSDLRKLLADTINVEGVIYSNTGRKDDALRAFRAFQEICLALIDDHRGGPKPVGLLRSLALSYYNEGAMLYRLDRWNPRVLQALEKALEYRRTLADAHPSVNDFRDALAQSLTEVAPLRHEAGRHAEGLAAIQEAVAIFEDLSKSQGDHPRYHALLGRALHILGYLMDEDRDNAAALPVFTRALHEVQEAVREAPESDLYRSFEVDVLSNLGEQYVDTGRVDRALPHYTRAVAIRRKLLSARPEDRDRAAELADQLDILAEVQRHGGDSRAAGSSFAEAAMLRASMPAPAAQVAWAADLIGEAVCEADRGDRDAAAERLRKAEEILVPLIDQPAAGAARSRLSEVFWQQARLARMGGKTDVAARFDDRRGALWATRASAPAELLALAIEQATRADRVGYGRTPLEPGPAEVRRLELDMAVSHLRLAVRLGLRDPSALAKREAASLRARRDVRTLIDDMEFPAQPFASEPGPR